MRAVAFLSSAAPIFAQFTTQLQPRTIQEFDAYAHKVEQQIELHWRGQRPFIGVDADPSERERLLKGDLLVRPGTPDNPVSISNGLVHDWVGTVFIPNTTLSKVLNVLEDFDHHSNMYPGVIRSRLIRRDGDTLTGYWRLQRKQGVLTVVLDVKQQVRYEEIGPGKWIGKAYARDISEIENAGKPNEKRFSPDDGEGFLWRLYAYWSLEATNGGVLGECRTLSLSRSVPAAVAFAVKPFLNSLPRESLMMTLQATRSAASTK
jgi:hypothetical protein